jgi:23S rRNA (pseudouridine1915-N3)-methyltransferase
VKFVLLTAQSSTSEWCESSILEYQKKINYFHAFEIKRVKGPKIKREGAETKREADSQAILKALEPGDFVILLDENGMEMSSLGFSKKLGQCIDQSTKKIVFVIGGPYGADEELKRRANLKISLSPMTMNHWVAQVVLIEQIYRAMTILKGLPYHNV